jgi:CHAD domain-containing protein
MARRVPAQRSRKLTRRIRKLESLSPTERHRLRIAVKKLHYGSEFFADLFRPREVERFAKPLRKLQNCLGKLNDLRTHESIAHELAREGQGSTASEQAFGAGFVTGRESSHERELLHAARRAGKKLAGAHGFWV